MDKKIKHIQFGAKSGSSWFKVRDIYCYYSSNNMLSIRVSYDTYDTNKKYINNLLNKGFNKLLINFNDELAPFSDEIVNKLREDERWDCLILKKDFKLKEVEEHFAFNVSIQINGKEIDDFLPLIKGWKCVDEDIITFISFVGNEDGMFGKFGPTADALFGPRFETECGLWHDARAGEEYRKHISEIEKVFLTKEFRYPKNIGTDKASQPTGKIERIELDLRHPDMSVYEKMRAIDNCIEIEWE